MLCLCCHDFGQVDICLAYLFTLRQTILVLPVIIVDELEHEHLVVLEEIVDFDALLEVRL